MTEYQTIGVGPGALDYLLKCLANGKQLAKLLAERSDLLSGSLNVLLPLDAHLDPSSNFEWAIALEPPYAEQVKLTGTDGSNWRAVRKPDMTQAFVDEINAFLSLGGDRLCVFEDIAAEQGDGWLERVETRLAYAETGDVYHLLIANDAGTDNVGKTILNARDWLTIGCLGSVRVFPTNSDQVSAEALSSLAAAAEEIVITAFDGDGWLVWSAPR